MHLAGLRADIAEDGAGGLEHAGAGELQQAAGGKSVAIDGPELAAGASAVIHARISTATADQGGAGIGVAVALVEHHHAAAIDRDGTAFALRGLAAGGEAGIIGDRVGAIEVDGVAVARCQVHVRRALQEQVGPRDCGGGAAIVAATRQDDVVVEENGVAGNRDLRALLDEDRSTQTRATTTAGGGEIAIADAARPHATAKARHAAGPTGTHRPDIEERGERPTNTRQTANTAGRATGTKATDAAIATIAAGTTLCAATTHAANTANAALATGITKPALTASAAGAAITTETNGGEEGNGVGRDPCGEVGRRSRELS